MFKNQSDLWWYRFTIVTLYVLFAVVGFILWCVPTVKPVAGKELKFDLAFLLLAAAYTIGSIRQVRPDQRAAKTLFGRPIQNIRSGLTFVPLFVCQLIRFSTNVQLIVIGSPRERATKRNPDGKIVDFELAEQPPGALVSEEPMRITSSSYEAAVWQEGNKTMSKKKIEKRFPTKDYLARRGTVDPQVIVRFVVHDPCQFVEVVGVELKKAVLPVAQATRATLQEFCGKRALALILHQLESEAKDHLRHALEKLVGDQDAKKRAEAKGEDTSGWKPSWGVDIQGVQISDIGLPFRVNQALADARAAGAEAEATITNAEAEKMKLELEGAGAASAARLLLEAQATGFKELSEAMKTEEGKLAAQLEAMKKALEGGQHKLFLVGGQFYDILQNLTGAIGQVKKT